MLGTAASPVPQKGGRDSVASAFTPCYQLHQQRLQLSALAAALAGLAARQGGRLLPLLAIKQLLLLNLDRKASAARV